MTDLLQYGGLGRLSSFADGICIEIYDRSDRKLLRKCRIVCMDGKIEKFGVILKPYFGKITKIEIDTIEDGRSMLRIELEQETIIISATQIFHSERNILVTVLTPDQMKGAVFDSPDKNPIGASDILTTASEHCLTSLRDCEGWAVIALNISPALHLSFDLRLFSLHGRNGYQTMGKIVFSQPTYASLNLNSNQSQRVINSIGRSRGDDTIRITLNNADYIEVTAEHIDHIFW